MHAIQLSLLFLSLFFSFGVACSRNAGDSTVGRYNPGQVEEEGSPEPFPFSGSQNDKIKILSCVFRHGKRPEKKLVFFCPEVGVLIKFAQSTLYLYFLENFVFFLALFLVSPFLSLRPHVPYH